jgi:hypothetical protein
MLRDMVPQSSTLSKDTGLVDIEIGEYNSSPAEIEELCIQQVEFILSADSSVFELPTTTFNCAPWCRPSVISSSTPMPLIDCLASNKYQTYTDIHRPFPPLQHYRNEELSQMLLDCFHPTRSQRYHTRRYRFIRKIKCTTTPARYALHLRNRGLIDEEEIANFDDAPDWARGEEWGWVGMDIPSSMTTSEITRIDLYPAASPAMSITSGRADYYGSSPPSPIEEQSEEHRAIGLGLEVEVGSPSPMEYQYQSVEDLTPGFESNISLATAGGPVTPHHRQHAEGGTRANKNLDICPENKDEERVCSSTFTLDQRANALLWEGKDNDNSRMTPCKKSSVRFKVRGGRHVEVEEPESPSPKAKIRFLGPARSTDDPMSPVGGGTGQVMSRVSHRLCCA